MERHSGPLSKGQRGGGNTLYRHTEVTPPLWSPCFQWTKRVRLGMMTKGLKVWSDWQLQLCRLKSTNDYRGKYLFYCLLPEEKKKRERRELVTLFLTVRSPKGETATRMWMERTRLVPTGWGECSESAVCRHRDSVNRTPLSCSTWLPHQLLHLLSSFPSISCSFISKDTRKKEIKIWHVPSRYKSICWTNLVDLKTTWGV